MKNRIFSLIAILAVALGMASCNDDNWNPTSGSGSEGTLSLSSLGVDIDDKEEIVGNSRASVDLSNFIIEITKGDRVVQKWTYSTMPEVFTLAEGEYTACVRSHELQDAEWDKPYYQGSKSFTIERNKITEIGTITCTFQSVRVSVTFTDDLKAAMGDDCIVLIEVGNSGTSMQFDKAHYGSSAYFRPVEGSMTLVATFKGTVQGNYTETQPYPFTDVAAGKHYRLNFSAKGPNPVIPEETGTVELGGGITLNTDILGVNSQTGNVEDEEGNIVDPNRPGKEDPKPEDALYFYGDIDNAGFTVQPLTDNAFTFTVASSATFTFTTDPAGTDATKAWGTRSTADETISANGTYAAAAGATGKFVIATAGTYTLTVSQSAKTFAVSGFMGQEPGKIEVTCATLSFDTPNQLGGPAPEGKVNIHADNKVAHLRVKIETSNAGFESAVSEFLPMEFDLAYPGEYAEKFKESLGFPVGDEVIGQTDVLFNITQFIPMLAGFEGTHKFTITIEDQGDPAASLSKTLTFVK